MKKMVFLSGILAVSIFAMLAGVAICDETGAAAQKISWRFVKGQTLQYNVGYTEDTTFGGHAVKFSEQYNWAFLVNDVHEDGSAEVELCLDKANVSLRTGDESSHYDSSKDAKAPEKAPFKEIAKFMIGKKVNIVINRDGQIADLKKLATDLSDAGTSAFPRVQGFLNLLLTPLSGKQGDKKITLDASYWTWSLAYLENGFPNLFKSSGYFTEKLSIATDQVGKADAIRVFPITGNIEFAHPDRKEQGKVQGQIRFSPEGFLVENTRTIECCFKDGPKDPRPTKTKIVWSIKNVKPK